VAVRRDTEVDAVVVGAGHNGLITAAYLARAGMRVIVCERRDVIGGAAVTEEMAPGFRVSTASYALSLLRPDIFADLDLGRLGLEVVAKDPQLFVPLPDGDHFFVWRDAARTREELARLSTADADAYTDWCSFWEEATTRLRPLVDTEQPPRLAGVERIVGADVWRWAVAGSAADTVERFFDHPSIQGCFASQGVIGTWASVREPGTAWVMAYHALGGELYGGSGVWGFARGGMGSVTGALGRGAEEAGADIRCGCAVEEILVGPGGVSGVRLSDGSIIRAGIVASGADPRTTFITLLPDDALDEGFLERVSAWDSRGCVVKVNIALTELPDFVALPGATVGPQHRGTVEISPSIDYLHEAFETAKRDGWSREPFMEVFVQSAVDPSLVEGDGHVLSAFMQYVSPGAEVLEDATKAVLSTIASRAPNVPGAIVAVEALGPRELEARFGLSGGNIFHGEITPEQSFGERFDYRTPLRGLYLCGSGARPGGCVMGAAGRNAAKVILREREAGGD
jgi:phytoene dehydrogenase-like protein